MGDKCDHHHFFKRKKFFRKLCCCFLVIILVIAFAIFLVWIILQPSKPGFILQDVTLYAFNLSFPNFLTSNLQITIAARNSNERIGIYYEKLHIYASYRNQQITLATELPRTYQDHKDTTVWSPFLYGNAVPLSPLRAAALIQDLNAGSLLLNIMVDGSLKWKVGSWMSGDYQVNVNCPVYLYFRGPNMGVDPGTKYYFVRGCIVEVSL